jgi:DNA-binding NarL/FixJ family response regulator
MPRRVLIAHPDETVLAALAQLVGGCGGAELVGQVSAVETLAEAAARTEPDVVVTGLPVWRGDAFDALRRLKRERPACYVMATADWPHGPYRTLALAAGADEVIAHLDCADRLRAVLAGDPPPAAS